MDAFRTETRAWLAANDPPDLRRPEPPSDPAGGGLRAKANSIEGGASEINLNVLAKQVLGLPSP